MQLPGEVKFNFFDSEGNMQELTVDELTKGKKVEQSLEIPAMLHSAFRPF